MTVHAVGGLRPRGVGLKDMGNTQPSWAPSTARRNPLDSWPWQHRPDWVTEDDDELWWGHWVYWLWSWGMHFQKFCLAVGVVACLKGVA